MSPRDRKQGRVLKRRRAAKRKDADNDDALERSCVEKRLSKAIKPRTTVPSSPETKQVTMPQQSGIASAQLKDSSPKEVMTNVERQRLKNQQRKALRKEKKDRKDQADQGLALAKEQERAKTEQQVRVRQLKKKVQREKEVSAKFQTMRLDVQYKDIVVGTGPVVHDRKKVQVRYTLRAGDKNGKVVDSSPSFGFRVGKGEVIVGWDIGLMGMRQGGLRHLLIPPQAGYGSHRNVGAGAGGMLFFEVALLAC